MVDAYLVAKGTSEKELQKCRGLKEKVAKVAAVYTLAAMPTPPAGRFTTPPEIHVIIHSKINAIITELETKFLSKTDFNEDFIIQNALLKNLPISLNADETKKLEEASQELKKHLYSDVLKTSLDFTHETPAQRIAKLEEILQKLLRNGEDIKPEIQTKIGELAKKLSQIEDLQKTSNTLHDSLYTLHEVARHGFSNFWTNNNQAALLPAETTKLLKALGSINGEAKLEEFRQKVINNPEGSLGYLQSLLDGCKADSAKYQTALQEARLTGTEFEKFFLVYFSRERLNAAKISYDAKKREVLGVNERVFEQDVNKWRGMMRVRIVEHYEKLSDNAKKPDPKTRRYPIYDELSEEDKLHYESLNGYFENFQSLFYGEERDGEHGEQTRAALQYILNQRAPTASPDARLATANSLAEYNQLQNQFYHNDRNPLIEEET